MIEGLNNLLEESGQPGLDELRGLVQEILGGDASRGRVLDQQRLPTSRPHAYRVRFVIDGWIRAVVVEWMKPAAAQRNQLVINRWLPAIGLGDNGPTLLGVAAEPNGQGTWHVYGDFGVRALDPSRPDLQGMRAAVGLIAQVHTRFAGHLLLPECRLLGRDLGINFYASTVRDALRALELLQPPAIELSSEHSALRDRLLARVHQLKDEQPLREQAVAAFGGPETLLQ